tara:strand:+ start:302 stop:1543 length:1242 start_codon:yes stop_codon:yes gene_type:complete
MPYIGTAPASELKILDINGEKFILDADADTHITADTDDQIDIAIAGADDFQFTANKFLVQTGSSIDINGTELIIDADADTSLTADTDDQIDIKVGGTDYFKFTTTQFGGVQGSASVPAFAWTTDPNTGMFFGSNGSGQISFTGEGSERVRFLAFSSGVQSFFGDTANTLADGGMTINQIADDEAAFALKSSDVGHSVTDVAETDTYFHIKKKSDSGGGALLEGFAESNLTDAGIMLRGYSEGVSGARSSSGTGPVMIEAIKADDADGSTIDNETNLCVFLQSGTTRFIIDKEGDTHADGSHNDTVFDDYDDVALLSASRHVTHIDKKFAKSVYGDFIQEHAQVLADNGVITLNDDGHHFVSTKGLNGLIIDAIRQTRNIQKAFYNILSDEQKNKFAGELSEMKLPVLPAFSTP